MKKTILLFVVMTFVLAGVTGCAKNPTDPNPATGVSTPTATPIPGGGLVPTATPTPGGSATPTPGSGTYTVKYEVISTGATSINITYLDSNTTSASQAIGGGTWETTVTISSGYETQIIGAYAAIVSPSPTLTLNIYVNGILRATNSLSGIGAAITASYWLP